jgi:mRNA-degrading endonuclease toxin of MazEF toxin-antitoxin module
MEGSLIRPGDIVIVKFPYIEDEEGFKNRPALVIATPRPLVSIVCEITTNLTSRPYAIRLSMDDFIEGSIRKHSIIRSDVIITMHHRRFKERAGAIKPSKLAEVLRAISEILFSETI